MRIAAAVLMGTGAAWAADEGTAIFNRYRAGESRWESRHQRLTLTIHERGQSARQREIEFFSHRFRERELRLLALVVSPADVAGTGYLRYSYPNGIGLQWIYTRAIRRTRELNAGKLRDSFLDSDLTLEDIDLLMRLPLWQEADAEAKFLREEPVEGTLCDVVDLLPAAGRSAYPWIRVWFGREDHVPRRVDLHGTRPPGFLARLIAPEAPPVKIIRQRDVRTVDTTPVAFATDIATPAAGTQTSIVVMKTTFNQVPEGHFRPESLARLNP